ncbi:MAG TPA: Gfo/Idh/MocA family oxidoreductase [Opitutaceae bacterium]|nr:Gfo/Idh/MocA family oxidoreductase [Opitutaceae bacterium]
MKRRQFLAQSAAALAATSIGAKLADAQGSNTAPAAPASGMNYAPNGKPNPVVKPGEFPIAAVRLDHGHINGMCNGLTEAGANIKWVFDPDPKKVEAFQQKFPSAKAARSLDEVLSDPEIKLVAAAAVTSERGPLGCRVMEAGKDYFSDKAPFTTLEQLEQARSVVARTSRKYMVYFSERIHNEAAMFATDLVKDGAIGRVLQVIGLGPHRLNAPSRPAWFFEREKYGGILCDIGSHQFEQYLTYTGATDASVMYSAIANHGHPEHPELEDFGEASLLGNNGTSNYIRVDWFTPAGLSNWGDGRTTILGTKGYIELRKYLDVGRERTGDHVYIVDEKGEQHLSVAGKVGFRFFGQLILDCLHRTENAMTQEHAFKAAELCLRAQAAARRIV